MRSPNRKAPVTTVLLAILFTFGGQSAHGAGEKIQGWIDRINDKKPDIIMVGNSMQGEGISFGRLSRETNSRVMSIRAGGSMSAWKYGIMRNCIAGAQHKVKVVIVVTRQNHLTSPRKRLDRGKYERQARRVNTPDDKMFEQLAFPPGAPPWPFASDRDPKHWDFPRNVKISLLPHMIRITKENNFRLVIARHKSRMYAESPVGETDFMKKYGEALATYLQENGVIFLDYVHHPDLKIEHYGRGDHLNRGEGRRIWTRLMSEDLKAVLAVQRAPNQFTVAWATGPRALEKKTHKLIAARRPESSRMRRQRKAWSPSALALWDSKLMSKLKGRLKHGHKPTFYFQSMRRKVQVTGIIGDDALKIGGSGLEITIPLWRLSLADRSKLARSVVVVGDPESRFLAAYYQRADGK